MKKSWLSSVALVTATSLVLAACGAERMADDDIVISLDAQVGSSPGGRVRLSSAGESRTRVELRLPKGAPLPRPAHVHAGTCDDLDPLPVYSLASIENGSSETVLPISLGELRSRTVVVNVHKSDTEMRTTVACAEIR